MAFSGSSGGTLGAPRNPFAVLESKNFVFFLVNTMTNDGEMNLAEKKTTPSPTMGTLPALPSGASPPSSPPSLSSSPSSPSSSPAPSSPPSVVSFPGSWREPPPPPSWKADLPDPLYSEADWSGESARAWGEEVCRLGRAVKMLTIDRAAASTNQTAARPTTGSVFAVPAAAATPAPPRPIANPFAIETSTTTTNPRNPFAVATKSDNTTSALAHGASNQSAPPSTTSSNSTMAKTSGVPFGTASRPGLGGSIFVAKKAHPVGYAKKIYDALARAKCHAPQWPEDGTKHQINDLRQSHKEFRDRARVALQKAKLIDDPDVPKSLDAAIDFEGICEDMCPEFEIIVRMHENDVMRAEMVQTPDGLWKAEPRLFVKKMARSAAGQEAPLPMDVRSAAALKKTLKYLIVEVLQGDSQLAKAHGYVWDRTRSIRRDFVFHTKLSVEDMHIQVECLETIARFHVTALHLLSEKGVAENDYSEHQEKEQLRKCLISLMQAYDDCRLRSIPCANEAEFRAYNILMNIQQPDFEQMAYDAEANPWFQADDVQFALNLVQAISTALTGRGPIGNYNSGPTEGAYDNFFHALHEMPVTYIMACFAEMHFNTVRRNILTNLARGLAKFKNPPKDITREVLRAFLWFDEPANDVSFEDDEAVYFADKHGFKFVSEGVNEPYLVLPRLRKLPRPELPQAFSRKVVESKRCPNPKGTPRLLPVCIMNTGPTVARDPVTFEYGKTEARKDDSMFVAQPDDNVIMDATNESQSTPSSSAQLPSSQNSDTTMQGGSQADVQPAMQAPSPFAALNTAGQTPSPFATASTPAGQNSSPFMGLSIKGQAATNPPAEQTSSPFATASAPAEQNPSPFMGLSIKGQAASDQPAGQTPSPFATASTPAGQNSSPFTGLSIMGQAGSNQSSNQTPSPFASSSTAIQQTPSPFAAGGLQIQGQASVQPSSYAPEAVQAALDAFKPKPSSSSPLNPTSTPADQASSSPLGGLQIKGLAGSNQPSEQTSSPFASSSTAVQQTPSPFASAGLQIQGQASVQQPSSYAPEAVAAALAAFQPKAPSPSASISADQTSSPLGGLQIKGLASAQSAAQSSSPLASVLQPAAQTFPASQAVSTPAPAESSIPQSFASSGFQPAAAAPSMFAPPVAHTAPQLPTLTPVSIAPQYLQPQAPQASTSTPEQPQDNVPQKPTTAQTAQTDASTSTPVNEEEALNNLTEWYVLGDGGLLEDFQTAYVESLLQETFVQYRQEEAERIRKEEDEKSWKEALEWRAKNLKLKFFYKWREIARENALQRRARQARDANKAYQAERRAKAQAAREKQATEGMTRSASMKRAADDGISSASKRRRQSDEFETQEPEMDESEVQAFLLASGVFSGVENEQEAVANAIKYASSSDEIDSESPTPPRKVSRAFKVTKSGLSRSVSSARNTVNGNHHRITSADHRRSLSSADYRRSLPGHPTSSMRPANPLRRTVTPITDRMTNFKQFSRSTMTQTGSKSKPDLTKWGERSPSWYWRMRHMGMIQMPNGDWLHEKLAIPMLQGKKVDGVWGTYGVEKLKSASTPDLTQTNGTKPNGVVDANAPTTKTSSIPSPANKRKRTDEGTVSAKTAPAGSSPISKRKRDEDDDGSSDDEPQIRKTSDSKLSPPQAKKSKSLNPELEKLDKAREEFNKVAEKMDEDMLWLKEIRQRMDKGESPLDAIKSANRSLSVSTTD